MKITGKDGDILWELRKQPDAPTIGTYIAKLSPEGHLLAEKTIYSLYAEANEVTLFAAWLKQNRDSADYKNFNFTEPDLALKREIISDEEVELSFIFDWRDNNPETFSIITTDCELQRKSDQYLAENQPGPRHRAGAIIIQNNRILLIRRWNHERGEYFIIPGGGIEKDESPEETITRELLEEAGVNISNLQPFSEDTDPTYNGKQYYFRADIPDDQEPVWQEASKQTTEDTYEFVWIEVSKLQDINLVPRSLRDKLFDIVIP